MQVDVDSCDVERWSQWQLIDYLRSKGLDTTKEVSRYENPRKYFSITFIGESLSDRVMGCLRTVVGLVPITKPW